MAGSDPINVQGSAGGQGYPGATLIDKSEKKNTYLCFRTKPL